MWVQCHFCHHKMARWEFHYLIGIQKNRRDYLLLRPLRGHGFLILVSLSYKFYLHSVHSALCIDDNQCIDYKGRDNQALHLRRLYVRLWKRRLQSAYEQIIESIGCMDVYLYQPININKGETLTLFSPDPGIFMNSILSGF